MNVDNYERAIEGIVGFKQIAKQMLLLSNETDEMKKIDLEELQDDFNLTIKALNKQIAQEPIFEYNCIDVAGNPSGCPVCPSCLEPHYNLRWCGFCGQKLLHK